MPRHPASTGASLAQIAARKAAKALTSAQSAPAVVKPKLHDIPIGGKILDEIDAAIRLRDKVLLILSESYAGD